MSQKIRCVRIKTGQEVFLAPHLGNNDKFLADNQLRRAQTPTMELPDAPPQPFEDDDEIEEAVATTDTPTDKSVDYTPATEAIKLINDMTSADEINAFIEGETRKTVMNAATKHLNEI